MVPILDVSGHQFDGYVSGGPVRFGTPDPDLAVAQALGVAGVFARVANGLTYDPWCELTLRAAERIGLERGVYTYIQPARSSAQVQASTHLGMIKRAGSITLPVMIDCEIFWDQDAFTEQQFADWLRIYVDVIAQGTQRAPIKYSAKWWWDRESTGDFGELDCILARYPAQPSSKPSTLWEQPPADPTVWASWALGKAPTGPPLIEGEDHWDGWQFSSWLLAADYGFQPGHRIDGNIVRPEAWARWSGALQPPPPVPVPIPVPIPPASQGDDEMLRMFVLADSPARFFAMCDSAGRALRCEWTGPGDDLGSNPRIEFYRQAHPSGEVPFEMGMSSGSLINVSLDGVLPQGCRAEWFANPAEIEARMTIGTVDNVARNGVSSLNASVATLGQQLGDTQGHLRRAGGG